MKILNDFGEIGDHVKDIVKEDYFTNIKDKVMYHKNKHIATVSKRYDF